MLNAIEPGSVVPIHRHRYSSETVVCLRGRVVEEYYDDLGRMCEEAIEITPNGPVVALNIPIGQWHTIRLKESGSVFFVFVLDIQGQAPVLGYIALSGHRKSKHEREILPFAHCHNIFIRDNPCM